MCAPGAGSPAAWAERRPPRLTTGPLARLGEGTLAMALAEVRKLRHGPPRHLHALRAAAAVAVHLRNRATAQPLTDGRVTRLSRLPGARRDGAGGDVHRDLLRPRR